MPFLIKMARLVFPQYILPMIYVNENLPNSLYDIVYHYHLNSLQQEGDDDGNSLVIEKDNVTGEIVSQVEQSLR